MKYAMFTELGRIFPVVQRLNTYLEEGVCAAILINKTGDVDAAVDATMEPYSELLLFATRTANDT